jgi:hypothetical protein
LFGEKEDKKVRNLVVPSNKEGGGEVEVRGGGRTSCTLLQFTIYNRERKTSLVKKKHN